MEEERKSKRPTVGQVRQLEAEIAELKETVSVLRTIDVKSKEDIINEMQRQIDEQIEGTSKLVKDCDDWRKKFRDLKEQFETVKEAGEKYEQLSSDFKRLEEDNATLKKSNEHLSGELINIHEKCKKKSKEYEAEIERLKNRNLWQRILNK